MQFKITPALKGLITAVLMIIAMLLLFSQSQNVNSGLQYIVYVIYGLGIMWTLIEYQKSSDNNGKFATLFNQGFKCFIVVTLCIALFYWIFNYMHPEFREKMGELLKEDLIKQTGDKQMLPAQIDEEVLTFKKQYALKLVSGAIFGYLLIGAIVTATASAILTALRKN